MQASSDNVQGVIQDTAYDLIKIKSQTKVFCFSRIILKTLTAIYSLFKFFKCILVTLYKYFLLIVRGGRPGRTVQMTEAEIRALCLKSREIFLSQPILLELEAPLKICGIHDFYLIYMFVVFLYECICQFV